MPSDYAEIAFRLVAALAVGSLIGLERSHRGRPAGFRTHALVCLASTLLMLVTVYETQWFPRPEAARVVLDPTRMAQGIMTGIGFVGAGAIIKEGFAVRGLTTAASIWITAAIGILTGIGFYFAAAIGALLVLGTLSLFRWVEARVPTELYANLSVQFRREAAISEAQLRSLVSVHGFSLYRMSYSLHREADVLEYRTVVHTLDPGNLGKLAAALGADPKVIAYSIAPANE